MPESIAAHFEAVHKHLVEAQALVQEDALAEKIDALIKEVASLPLFGETVDSPESTLEKVTEKQYVPEVFDIATLLKPVSEDAPGGEDCRLSGDMNRLLSLVVNRKREAEFKPQYSDARKLAEEILVTKSKDLGVAVRLIEAAFVSHGLPALADGLLLINGLLENYWSTLFPEYDEYDFEPRGNAIQGLQELICAQIQLTLGAPHNYAPQFSHREDVEKEKSMLDTALSEFEKLNKYCYDNFGDDAPNIDDLRQDIQVLHNAVMREYQIYVDEDNAAADAQKRSEVEAEEQARLVAENEEQRNKAGSGEPVSLEDVLGRLKVCVQYLMENHTDDPLPYIINRGLYWFSNSNQITCDIPNEEDKKAVAALASAANAKGLLQKAEECFVQGGHHWIDLQWYQVLSAERLGKGFEKVAEVLSDLTGSYIARHEALKAYTFPDDIEALSEGARKWVDTLETSSGVSSKETERDSRYEEILHEAESLVANQGVGDALEHLIQHVESARSGREATLWQLYLIEFAIKHGQARPVIPYVEKLVEEISAENLHTWEDRTFLGRVYQAGYDCYINAFGVQKAPKEKVDHYYNLVCSVNPTAFIQKSN